MKKYEQYTEQELREIILNSCCYKDALIKLGYKGNPNNNKVIKEISLKYNIDISHFKWQIKNIVNKRFGKLVVQSQKNSYCDCICDCGNKITILYGELNSGKKQSCGCLHSEQLSQRNKDKARDITGMKSGLLIALEDTGETSYYGHIWKCKCEGCNKIVYKPATLITTQRIASCGCASDSKAVLKAKEILLANNIIFENEYTFSDLVDKLPLRFDFAIFNKKYQLQYLIEIDGEQHKNVNNHFYSESIAKHDKMKNLYCLNKGIPLIRIPYYDRFQDINNITLSNLQIETSKFLLKRSDVNESE